MRVRRSFHFYRWAVLPAFLVSVVACNGLKTRSEIEESQQRPVVRTPERSAPTQEFAPSAQAPSVAPPAPVIPPSLPPAQAVPTFLNRELPKVGLILGPGGMKTYAEIGVLRELSKARIPIHAVAGLEWGAVIGSLFAMQGQVNDAEWKAFKLKEQDIPEVGGFLSSSIKPQSIATLSSFLDTVYGSAEIEHSKIDFACPAYWSRVDRFGWMSHGQIREAMRACVPYLPIYTDNAGVSASPFSIEEAAQYLRSRGANLIVLVNVLGQGEILPSKAAAQDPAEAQLWSEIRRQMMRARSPNVHFVINVNTSGHPMTDFVGRRALMDAGAKASGDVIAKMVSQYGF